MKVLQGLTVLISTAILTITLTSRLAATEWDKKTMVEFRQPVEIPGMVLGPGKYVVRLMDSQSDRHIVQIYNADESHLYATLLTIPEDRLHPSSKTIITFEERSKGAPEAIKSWFYPGDPIGEELVYPKPRAMQLAEKTNQNVLAMPAAAEKHIAEPAPQSHVAEMKKAPVTRVTPQKQEVEIAQVRKPVAAESIPAPAVTAPKKLPETASDMPLFLLLGISSLGLGAVCRYVSPRNL